MNIPKMFETTTWLPCLHFVVFWGICSDLPDRNFLSFACCFFGGGFAVYDTGPQTMHKSRKREIPQIYHTFVLFDTSKMGNLLNIVSKCLMGYNLLINGICAILGL